MQCFGAFDEWCDVVDGEGSLISKHGVDPLVRMVVPPCDFDGGLVDPDYFVECTSISNRHGEQFSLCKSLDGVALLLCFDIGTLEIVVGILVTHLVDDDFGDADRNNSWDSRDHVADDDLSILTTLLSIGVITAHSPDEEGLSLIVLDVDIVHVIHGLV